MKITLERLTLHNFKGLRDFNFETEGRSVSIFGDNGTGKTTVADAFMWLLFDKNTQDRADFEIKTLQKDGEPMHGLDHSVEGCFSVAGETLTLKKVYREKWTKQRGSASKQFTGHEVDHFITGVPVKKGEYTEKVKNLIREDVFKLLTNVRHFNEGLHWEKRRELLLDICGDVSLTDIFISNPELSELRDILGSRTLDEYTKIVTARRTEINKQLEMIPIRIDELSLSRKDTGINLTEAISEKTRIRSVLNDLGNKKAEMQSGGAVGEKTAKLRELEAELMNQRTAMNREGEAEEKEARQAITLAEEELSAKLRDKAHAEEDIKVYEEEAGTLNEKLQKAHTSYTTLLDEKVEDPTVSTVCPACSQELPEEKVTESFQAAKAIRNAERAQKLEELSTEAAKWSEYYQQKIVKLAQIKTNLKSNILPSIHTVETRIAELQKKHDAITPAQNDTTGLQAEIEKAKNEIEQARQNSATAIDEIKEQIRYNESELETLETAINQENMNKQNLDRESELKTQERELASEYEELERHIHLIEEFTRAKVKMLNAKINERFKFAEFKLFNELVNGGIEPTCITTYQGVPYNNLNNGARINIGIDIINTLAGHYGVLAPIFIDQREAVTRLIDTDTQTVSLVVSEPDKELLRVELQ